ncbi:hypothetical protein [Terribacillus saccharophilus]
MSSVWDIDNYDLDAANSPSIEQLMFDELTLYPSGMVETVKALQ